MDALSLYVVENSLVRLPDFLIAGAGFYLFRFTRHRLWGLALLLLYVLAFFGSGADPWAGAMAALGLATAELAGRARFRRRQHS